jgi:hypothetical protein
VVVILEEAMVLMVPAEVKLPKLVEGEAERQVPVHVAEVLILMRIF